MSIGRYRIVAHLSERLTGKLLAPPVPDNPRDLIALEHREKLADTHPTQAA